MTYSYGDDPEGENGPIPPPLPPAEPCGEQAVNLTGTTGEREGLAFHARKAGLASGRARRTSGLDTVPGIQIVLRRVSRGLLSRGLEPDRAELLLRTCTIALDCIREATAGEIVALRSTVAQLSAEVTRLKGAA